MARVRTVQKGVENDCWSVEQKNVLLALNWDTDKFDLADAKELIHLEDFNQESMTLRKAAVSILMGTLKNSWLDSLDLNGEQDFVEALLKKFSGLCFANLVTRIDDMNSFFLSTNVMWKKSW